MTAQKIIAYKDIVQYTKQSTKMLKAGWRVSNTTYEDKHINVGRTLTRTILTGGLGLMLGGPSRSGGRVIVVWEHL